MSILNLRGSILPILTSLGLACHTSIHTKMPHIRVICEFPSVDHPQMCAELVGERVVVGGQRVLVGRVCRLGEKRPGDSAFKGMEGSPVYSDNGVFLGAVHSILGLVTGDLFGIVPAEELLQLRSEGRQLRTETGLGLFDFDDTPADVYSGDAVALVRWWGGISDFAEMGSVTMVHQEEVLCGFPKRANLLPRMPRPIGRSFVAVVRAIPVAFGRQSIGDDRLCTQLEPIGTAVIDNAIGTYCILGVLPATCRVKVSLRAKQVPLGVVQFECLVGPGKSMDWLLMALDFALLSLDLQRTGLSDVMISLDDNPASSFTLTGVPQSPLNKRIVECIRAELFDQPPQSLDVVITLQ